MIQTTCVNHPQRKAIGVCVMTGKPICSECSTRYEGVNYSKEGLAMLQAKRQAGRSAEGGRLWSVLGLVLSPLLVLALYGFLWYGFRLLIDLQQVGFD